MSVFWKFTLWILALVAITGCQTNPTPPLTYSTVTISNTLEIAPAEPLAIPAITSPPPVVVSTPAWPSNWVNAWIPLETWGKHNGLKPFTVVSSNPHPFYQFPTPHGVVSLKLGTRIAYCNGLECWLGHAPQMVQGLPSVHWLDAQKVLQPLLEPFWLAGLTNRTIVLDPGHGGLDSGTKNSYNFQYEKEYTLDWALRLANLLRTNGWKVILTRTGDLDLPISERIAIADRAQAGLFLSLHFNSGLPNRELAGLETYCLTAAGMPSSTLRNHDEELQPSYPNNAYDEENFQLAIHLHNALVLATESPDRGVRRARFMGVLRGQNRPAVLIEGGYFSNLKEARNIAGAEYRQKLAEAIASVLGKHQF